MDGILNALQGSWQWIGGGVEIIGNGIGQVASGLGEGAMIAVKTIFMLG